MYDLQFEYEGEPLTDAEARKLHDQLLDSRHYDEPILGGEKGEDALITKGDGLPLLAYVRSTGEMRQLLRQALPGFQVASERWSEKRQADSGSVGFLAPNSVYPFGRTSAFTKHNRDFWKTMVPVFAKLNEVYARTLPREYAMQNAVAKMTSTDFLIPGTCFTTGTVNGPNQFPCHHDKKNLAIGMSVMTVWRKEPNEFRGAYVVFPQWRIAVNMMFGDVLIMDGYDWHGNSPASPKRKFNRISIVAYYQSKMLDCGSFEDEEEKAKSLVR